MFRVGFLLCIVTIGVCPVSGDGEFPASLVYACKPSPSRQVAEDAIEILFNGNANLNQQTNIHASKVSDKLECTVTNTANSSTIKGCWNTQVLVIISSSTNTNTIGGKGTKAYIIECEGPQEGINVSFGVWNNVTIGQANAITEEKEYAYVFTMTIDKTPGHDQIVVGDKLTMTINGPKSSNEIHWRVNNCSAASGNVTMLLYKGGSFIDPTMAEEVSPGTAGKQDVFKAFLWAFHAMNDNRVSYVCFLDECRIKGSGGSGTECTKQLTTRRRRSLDNAFRLHEVSKTILVNDRFVTFGDKDTNGAATVGDSPRVHFVSCFSMLILWMLK